jgi:hypothetical protein
VRSGTRRVAVVSALLVVAGGAIGSSAAAPADRPAPTTPAARGLTFEGLDRDEACEKAFRVVGVDGTRCTNGPDPAPPGRDVRRDRSVQELAADTATGDSTSTSGTVPCFGDGTTGKRVQAVYARAADVPDRYADLLPLIRTWAGTVNDIVVRSAAKTDGVRNVRWVTTPGCELDVVNVTLSRTGDDTYSNTVYELSKAGLNRTDRKYLVWVDAGLYCGLADFVSDDSAGSRNKNNGGPSYSRIDRGCWGYADSTEAHELFHMLGSVQYSAPNTSGGGHCLDEHDLLCYRDSIYVETRYVCDFEHEKALDCGNDDYFHTSPPSGSYLATHWNAANSEFLTASAPDGSPSSEPTSEPTTSPTKTKGGGGGKGGGRTK